MAFIKLNFRPGVNRDQTNYSNEGGWYACDLIRFRSGYPQKIGGWVNSTPGNSYVGVCRQMWNWVTTFNDDLLALGTSSKIYLETGGYYYDITPFDDALSGSNTFATTSGVKQVTVTTATALPSWVVTGEPIQIAGFVLPNATSVGGVPAAELNGVHTVTVTGTNSFTFSTTTTPTTASVSGAVYTVQTEIEPGNAISVKGLGWGVGPWFPTAPNIPPNTARAWGLGYPTGGVDLPQQDWWFDNFDNDLAMNIRNGAPYWWQRGATDNPSTALGTHAITLQELATKEGFDPDYVPVKVMQLLVSQQYKILIAFGAVPYGYTSGTNFDPMLIRWADQDTPSDWNELSTTGSAGSLRVSRGSRIIRAMPARQEILVWTDTNLYTLQFTGTTDVFSLQEYADNISVASPRCMASAANVVYWMGQDKFYAYTGRVETLPCTLRDHVFNNINFSQSDQIICGTNEQWNEIWWFYPTEDSQYNNAYVIYNHLERIWYYGYIDRTAWLDTPVRHWPQAANATVTTSTNGTVTVGTGYLYSHENGVDADGEAMSSYIQSSDFDLDDGDKFMLIRRILPDVSLDGSTTGTQPEVTLTVLPRNFPGSAFKTSADTGYDTADNQTVRGSTAVNSTVTSYTDQVFVRARARQIGFMISSTKLGTAWQLGAPRLDARPDGTR